MLSKMPYFLENEEWYYHDKKKNRYVLTDKAPEKAKQSYNEYYGKYDRPDLVLVHNILIDAENKMRSELKNLGKSPEEIEQEISEWKRRINS